MEMKQVEAGWGSLQDFMGLLCKVINHIGPSLGPFESVLNPVGFIFFTKCQSDLLFVIVSKGGFLVLPFNPSVFAFRWGLSVRERVFFWICFGS